MQLQSVPPSTARDVNDSARLRHARERQIGFAVGQYLQPPPMLFTRDGHNAFLGDMYRGRPAFLVCAGPSLTSHDLSLLERRGILTLAVNNAAAVIRPRLWCSVDDPGNFVDAIWQDPGILKFVPLCHMEKTFTVRNDRGELVESVERVGDMPAVFGYRRNESFNADQWLYEDTFNWGNHGDVADTYGLKGGRSVMYVALRLLFYLGIRRVYLLGCDFRMEMGRPNYAFEQKRSKRSVRGNNYIYQAFNVRMQHLLPHFERADFSVFNCTPNSGLTVFPFVPYEQAIENVTVPISKSIVTAGMYDRKAREQSQGSGQKDAPASRQMGRAVLNPAELAAALPRISLVVPLRCGSADTFVQAWRTWRHFKPWLSQFPLVILHEPCPCHCGSISSRLDGQETHEVEVPWDAARSANLQWERIKVKNLPLLITTPWYLLLSPMAIATSTDDWLSPALFDKDPEGRPLAIAAPTWSYTKPANVIQILDDWGDSVPSLRIRSRLDLPFDGTSDRIRHDAVTGWALLVRTEWAREVAGYVDGDLPCTGSETLLHFCALRRGERCLRIPMKRFGWDHSHGWKPRDIALRCHELLGRQSAGSYGN